MALPAPRSGVQPQTGDHQGMPATNAVFGLSLVVSQASSPAQAMRLVTTAVPSVAPGHAAVAWHPSTSGDYFQRAPEEDAPTLARLTGPGLARRPATGSAGPSR